MVLLRRFLVMQLLMLWQGGFLFYALFVVPVGTDVLGSAFEQGRITRFVTRSMNLVGVAALGIMLWELICQSGNSKRSTRSIVLSWLIMALSLIVLFWLHPLLEADVDYSVDRFRDRVHFRLLHRTYLWVCTIQWLAGLIFVGLLVARWRRP